MPKIASKIEPTYTGPVVDADKLDGVVPVASGGTGNSTLSGLKNDLSLNNVDNTSDVNKPVSTAQAAAISTALSTNMDSFNTVLAQTETARDEALNYGSAIVKYNWYEAEVLTGLTDGDGVIVLSSDTGTHISVSGDFGSVANQTPNSGFYQWSALLSKLVRRSDLESALINVLKDQIALSETRIEAFTSAITTTLDSYVSDTIAEGLADTEIPNNSFFPVVTNDGRHFLVKKINSTTSGTIVEYNTVVAFEAESAIVQAAKDEALQYGTATVVASYTEATALSGLTNGQAVYVLSVDAGTHTSVAGDFGSVSGQTPNSGYYAYSTALSALVKKGPLESTLVKQYRDQTKAYFDALGQMFDGYIFKTVNAGLTDPAIPNDSFFPVISDDNRHYVVYKDSTGQAGQTIEYATAFSGIEAPRVRASFTTLAAMSGWVDGMYGMVTAADAGTHAASAGDVGASGGQTPNRGHYVYSGSLSKLIRAGDLESYVSGINKDITTAHVQTLGSMFDGFIYQSIAEGLADPEVPNGTFFPVIASDNRRYDVFKVNSTTAGQTIEYGTVYSGTDIARVRGAYSVLSAMSDWVDGQNGIVTAIDTGTHASVVGDVGASGGQTPNSGYYVYNASIPGLVRVGALDSQISADYASDAADSAASISAVSGFEANAAWTALGNAYTTLTINGLTDLRLQSDGSSSQNANIRIPPVASGSYLRIMYKCAAESTGTAPNLILRTEPNSLNASNATALIRDGAWHELLIQTTANAQWIRIYNSSTTTDTTLTIFCIPGRASDTNQSRPQSLMHAFASALLCSGPFAFGRGAITGTPSSSVTTYPSGAAALSNVTVSGFSANIPSGSGYDHHLVLAPIEPVAVGQKGTLVYLATGKAPTAFFMRLLGGAPIGSGSNSATIIPDGKLRSVILTATQAASAFAFQFFRKSGDFSVKYLIVPGALSDAQVTAMSGVLLAILDIIAGANIETWNNEERQPYAASIYAVQGRKLPLYPRQALAARKRLSALDVGFISAGASTYGTDGGPSKILTGASYLEADPAELKGAGTTPRAFLDIVVKDPADANPRYRYVRRAPLFVAAATQTGSSNIGWLGTSYGGYCLHRARTIFEKIGGIWAGRGYYNGHGGAVATVVGNANVDTFSGRGLRDVVGRRQTTIVPGTSNPYVRLADATDKINNPTMCYAITGGSASRRPNYAEDSGQGTYYIFDWNVWRVLAGVNLSASDQITMFCDHFINDNDSTVDWVTETVANYVYVIGNFLATFSNGHFVIHTPMPQANVQADCYGYANYYQSEHWVSFYKEMLTQFRDRDNERIHMTSANLHVAADVTDVVPHGDVIETDTATGVVTYGHNVSSVVHYSGASAAQFADVMACTAACVHQGVV